MLIANNTLKEEYVNVYSLVKYKIGIPIFQRFYDWKEKQVEALLSDVLELIESNDKQIYLLDFIGYFNDDTLMLADGQQRLVSLNLLFLAINNYIIEKKLNLEQIDLFDITYDIEEHNKKYYDSINDSLKSPFKKIYFKFYDYVDYYSAFIPKIIKILKNNIYVFLKITDNIDEAFDIFQQINTGGKPLSKDEVISSTIQQFSKKYKLSIDYKNIKNLKDKVLGYYKYLKEFKSENFDTLSIMSFLNNDIVSTEEKFREFKKSIDITKTLENSPIFTVAQYLNRKQVTDILYVMSMKGINIDDTDDYKKSVILPLFLLSIILTMKKTNPGGIIKTLFLNIIKFIKEGKTPTEISKLIIDFIGLHSEFKITFKEFKENLGNPELNTNIKKSLLIIDVIISNVSSKLEIKKINLEHIYPKKPDLEWSKQGWIFVDEEVRKRIYDNIGNYMLLNENINKSIQNKFLSVKIQEYNKIIPRDLSLNTKINSIDFKSMMCERENYIFKRQEMIADYIYNNFYLAKVFISN